MSLNAEIVRRFADQLGKPAFAGTPFPTGGVEKSGQLREELGRPRPFLFGGLIRC